MMLPSVNHWDSHVCKALSVRPVIQSEGPEQRGGEDQVIFWQPRLTPTSLQPEWSSMLSGFLFTQTRREVTPLCKYTRVMLRSLSLAWVKDFYRYRAHAYVPEHNKQRRDNEPSQRNTFTILPSHLSWGGFHQSKLSASSKQRCLFIEAGAWEDTS